MKTIYDFTVKTQDEQDFSLEAYKGKILLVVNTATGCGLTPQYEGLESLYQTFKGQGLEVLDFPCNQFKNQAPGTAEEINTFCSLHYQTSFPRFQKIEVNGKNTIPLYQWLKKEKGGTLGSAIKWNFTKFLVDQEGRVVKRYAPTTEPADIEADILSLLNLR